MKKDKIDFRIEYKNTNGEFETFITRKQMNLIIRLGKISERKAQKKLDKIIKVNENKNKFKKLIKSLKNTL